MRILMLALMTLAIPAQPALAQTVERPAALVADGPPEIPRELASLTRPYLGYRTATFLGWQPKDRSMLIATRFGNTSQVHRVSRPDGARVQLSFEEEPIANASSAPRTGDVRSSRRTWAAMSSTSFTR